MTYEVRSFDRNGNQAEIIPGAQIAVTDELFTNGSMKVTAPRTSIGAARLSKRLEVALFLDGVEVDNTRAILTDHTGNPSTGGDAAGVGDDVVYAGKTLFAQFRTAVTYPKNWPASVIPPYHDFNSTTAGMMFKALLERAQSRGALLWVDHSSWSNVRDSAGNPWTLTASLRYEPGTAYNAVLENFTRLGLAEYRMRGRRFDLYNPDGVGKDLTIGPNPVILRRGRDVIDTPYSESTDDLSNVVLVVGDSGGQDTGPLIFERSDADSVSLFGRAESLLSQGSTKDVGTLATLADANLDRYASERGEYSTKFTPDTVGPAPFRDFGTGDWVFLDKSGTLERYRVRQLSITTQDDSYEAVATLNDRFTELDLRTAKKVEGILGGANQDTVQPAKPDDTDYTIPKPPPSLSVETNLYTDPNGARRGNAVTNWNPPSQNTDGSAIDDLAGYEIEHQTDGQVVYDVPASLWPMRAAPDLSARFDRRGKVTPGWIGADGGGNWQADNSDVWHCWGDTLWGTLASDGKRINSTMPRNTLTSFSPSVAGDLVSYAGVQNLVPLAAARADATGAWSGVTNCTPSAVAWSGGLSGRAVQLSATAAGIVAVQTSLTRTTSQGSTYKPVRGGRPYRVMCTFDTAGTVPTPRVTVIWRNDAGGVISSQIVNASAGVVDQIIVSPANTVTADIQVMGTASAASQVLRFTMPGVFETNHQLGAWRLPAQTVTVVNEVANPDGAATSGSTEVRRNYSTNPGFYSDLAGVQANGGASVVRDTQYVHGVQDGTAALEVVNSGALAPWRTALAASGTAQANIVVTGTSVSSGLSTTKITNRYQTRLQELLRDGVPVAGVSSRQTGYKGLFGFIPAWYQADPYAPSLPGSGGINFSTDGLGAQATLLQGGDYRRFEARFTQLNVHYLLDSVGAGNLQVTIDGQSWTINTYSASASRSPAIWQCPATFASATHVVELRNIDGKATGSATMVGGVELFDGDKGKGVHIYDGAHSGWAAQDNVTYPGSVKSIGAVKPHLVTIELGYNDAGRGRTSAQVKADIQTFMSAVRSACSAAGGPAPAFLIIGGYDPGAAQYGNPNQAPGGWPEPWPNYLAAMRTLATGDAAYVDLSTVMPRISDDTTGLYDGSIHPSDSGHALIARLLYPVLNTAATANRRASVRVKTAASTSGSGWQTGYDTTSNWANGDSWTYSAWVKAPAGAKLQLITAAPPTGNTLVNFTGTGDWQRVSGSGKYTATPTSGPVLAIRTPDTSQGAFTFYAGDVQLEKGTVASDYFDGETAPAGGQVFGWTGTRYASASTAGLPRPVGWSGAVAPTTTSATIRYNPTAVRETGAWVIAPTVATTTAGPHTAVAWVMSPTGGTARLDFKGTSGTVNQGATVTLPAGVWTEARAEFVGGPVTGLAVNTTGTSEWFVSEMTVVAGEWSGGSFTGASRNNEQIKCSWQSTPNASRSQALWSNTTFVDVGFNFFGDITTADRVMELFDTSGLPAGHVGEWCWPADGAYTSGNKAVVIYETVMSDASVPAGWNFAFNGSFWIAEYDLGAKRLTRARRFGRDPRGGKQCINWGGAVFADSGYVYIYGNRTLGASASNYVLRATPSNAYAGPYEVWTSSGWKAAPAGADMGRLEIDGALPTPASIVSTPDAGFSSVRKFRGKFYALALGGFQKSLAVWQADAPSGPWTRAADAYKFPDPSLMYYSAKWQPGTDDNRKGYGALFCQSSGDSIMNPGLYIPAWVRSGAGAITAGAGGTTWKDNQDVSQPPAAYGNLNPGSVYSSRVRTVDNSGNKSEWVVSQPVIISPDTQGPSKPSTPIAYAQFRGARVIWDGLDYAGVAQPGDFAYYTVNMSESESFDAAPQNMVDKVGTAGGISSIQDLEYGKTYWIRLVAYDRDGNASEQSDAVSVTPERLSDPDLPDKLITGAKIADGAVNTEKLTVAAFGENLIPGGNMEDTRADGTLAGWRGFFVDDPYKDASSPIAGSGSMRLDVGTSNAVVYRTDQAIPITPGAVYYVAAKVKTSRELDAPHVSAYLAVADTAEKAGAGFGQDTQLLVGATLGDSSIVSLEKGVEVPWDESLRFGRIIIRGEAESSPYTAWIDDVEVRKITGEAAIADASINNAKIRNLAVDDAKISDLSVGKITAGRIFADWVQSGRLLTPPGSNGSWSLMDSVGFHVYTNAAGTQKSFDTSNGNTWMSGVLEAAEIRGGQAFFPSQYANVPGRTSLTDQGLAVDAAATVNLCPTPSFETTTYVYPQDTATEVYLQGAATTDYAGNVDIEYGSGVNSIKVYNKTKNGYLDLDIGKAQPSTTYTVSWNSAATRIDDTSPGWSSVYGDYSTMGVIRADNGARIATGRSGYLRRTGALAGVWNQPLSSGIDMIASPGWDMRTFLTFTTPASLPANQALRLRLPAPRTTSNGNETTFAVCYDAIQLEQQPWMTRYCDGDQPGCQWDGARHNSTSRRTVQRSFWAPTQDEPMFQGSVEAPSVAARKIKVGSGIVHGSNAVETLMGQQWEVWSGGGGWWSQIVWDNAYVGLEDNARVRLQGQYTSDDGVIFPVPGSGGSKFFTAVTGGLYAVSATVTFPPPQQQGNIGLRLRHLGPGGVGNGDGSILVQNFQGTDMPSNVVSVTWTGWSGPGWRFYFEAFQTTQSGTATMGGHSKDKPCRASCIQFA